MLPWENCYICTFYKIDEIRTKIDGLFIYYKYTGTDLWDWIVGVRLNYVVRLEWLQTHLYLVKLPARHNLGYNR